MVSVRKTRALPDYTHCNQTITIYHVNTETWDIKRAVIENGAFFGYKKRSEVSKIGAKVTSELLVVIPQSACKYMQPEEFTGTDGTYTLFCLDKIYVGVGPKIITREEWASFISSLNPYVFIVKNIEVLRIKNEICHVEVT